MGTVRDAEHLRTTWDPVRPGDKPKLAGPVMMWADEQAKYGFDGACHRCYWTLAEALKWTIVPLDQAFMRQYIMWHTYLPHENGLPGHIISKREV